MAYTHNFDTNRLNTKLNELRKKYKNDLEKLNNIKKQNLDELTILKDLSKKYSLNVKKYVTTDLDNGLKKNSKIVKHNLNQNHLTNMKTLDAKLFGENPYTFCIGNKANVIDAYSDLNDRYKNLCSIDSMPAFKKSILNFISEKCYSIVLKLKNKLNFVVEYPKEKDKPLVITCINPISILSDDLPDKGKILEEVKLAKWKFFREIYSNNYNFFIEILLYLINPILSKGVYVRKFEITEDELIKYYENRLE